MNYNKLMIEEIAEADKIASGSVEKKPSLLLHSCCGPCSCGCLERLVSHFEVTIYFYNPNIDPESEFNLRLEAQKKVLEIPQFSSVKLIVPENQFTEGRKAFIDAIDLARFPERRTEKECGSRCAQCYAFRLEKTASYAYDNGFDYWSTTLTLGPQKDAVKINSLADCIQERLTRDCDKVPRFLHADFKKDNGYLRSIQLCKEYGIYRQQYCGCVFGREVQFN